jgi:hypothetical protein
MAMEPGLRVSRMSKQRSLVDKLFATADMTDALGDEQLVIDQTVTKATKKYESEPVATE